MAANAAAWRLYRWSRDAWEGMLEAIEEAKSSIDFEQYYFVDLAKEKIGGRFLAALMRKAKEGVKIRLLLDATGSWEFYRSNVPERLRRAGVEVEFHKLLSLKHTNRFFQSFLRDHRRLLIVDDAVAFLGGIAIKEEAAFWRDTHVRLIGPVVENLAKSFSAVWEGMRGMNMFHTIPPAASPDTFTVLPNGILPHHRYIPRRFLEGIHEAVKSIYITTPYFAPDHSVFRALRLAALRGVDVRIMLPETSDSAFAAVVAESFFAGALHSGIRLYRYAPAFLHAKTIVIDGDWGSVGSCNFDQLSFHLNFELNVLSYDERFALELRDHFFDDLQSSVEVLPQEWKRRNFIQKILEKLSFLARPFV